MIINLRERENLQLCLEALSRAKISANKQLSYEFVTLDLRQVLESLVRAIDDDKHFIPEDILNNIFSRFCIGK
jgi:tRNA U34 5-carboxymethylaminomethyl modifying GTPase MnmE/TrmE